MSSDGVDSLNVLVSLNLFSRSEVNYLLLLSAIKFMQNDIQTHIKPF